MFSLAKSLNMVAMNDVARLYTSSPDSPCGNLIRIVVERLELWMVSTGERQ